MFFNKLFYYIAPSAPTKPALYPVVQTTGHLAPAYQVDKYPQADFSKPTGYVIYGPKPPSEGLIYDQIEDWILDIFNLFNATFGKVMLALVIIKKAVKLLVLLTVLLFLPQLQLVLQKLTKVSYAKTGPLSEWTDGFPFYLPTSKYIFQSLSMKMELKINLCFYSTDFTYNEQYQLKDLQFLLQTSIEAFANKNLVCPGDDDIHCRLSMVFDQVDGYHPYTRFYEILQGRSTTASYNLNLLSFTTESPTTTTTTSTTTTPVSLRQEMDSSYEDETHVEMLEEPIYLYD